MTIGPKLVKAGLVVTDPSTGTVLGVIAMQYNPDSLTRSLKAQLVAGQAGHQTAATRFSGSPVETLKLDVEIDATDQLAAADPTALEVGIHPQLSVLEGLVSPTSTKLVANHQLAASGALEVLPEVAPLILFVWGKQRIAPVQITDASVTEEAFDPSLNPIRAKVSLSMRVLTLDDLTFDSRGGAYYLAYLQSK
jgi:hypothetical protein